VVWKYKIIKIKNKKYMNNSTTWLGMNPLTLTIKGSGKYVKEQCGRLVEMFDGAELDHEEEMRQEYEESQKQYLKDNDLYIL
jgi:hypothetical protein